MIYLCTSDIYVLINYASFVESSFILLSIASLLWLRWKQPDMPRPIRVTIIIPIAFFIICSFLVLMPFYVEPVVIGMGLLITVLGIPVYLVGVMWKNKPKFVNNFMGNFFQNSHFQKLIFFFSNLGFYQQLIFFKILIFEKKKKKIFFDKNRDSKKKKFFRQQ